MPEEIETILRLVSEGHLSAEEAAPIIEALQGAGGAGRAGARDHVGTAGRGDATGQHGGPAGEEGRAGPGASRTATEGSHQLRIEVIEQGRAVVNLRVPLGLAWLAVDRVPGLPGQYRDPIREAIRAGLSGPIVDVGDGGDRVRVVLE